MKISGPFIFLGPNSIFARRKKRSRKFEEGFSKKNKDVRICIKTRKVCVSHYMNKINEDILFYIIVQGI